MCILGGFVLQDWDESYKVTERMVRYGIHLDIS